MPNKKQDDAFLQLSLSSLRVPKWHKHYFPFDCHVPEIVANVQASGYMNESVIVVRPISKIADNYEIIAGFERADAARNAGHKAIYCFVKSLDEQEARRFAIEHQLRCSSPVASISLPHAVALLWEYKRLDGKHCGDSDVLAATKYKDCNRKRAVTSLHFAVEESLNRLEDKERAAIKSCDCDKPNDQPYCCAGFLARLLTHRNCWTPLIHLFKGEMKVSTFWLNHYKKSPKAEARKRKPSKEANSQNPITDDAAKQEESVPTETAMLSLPSALLVLAGQVFGAVESENQNIRELPLELKKEFESMSSDERTRCLKFLKELVKSEVFSNVRAPETKVVSRTDKHSNKATAPTNYGSLFDLLETQQSAE